jgi:hypothetical protein
VVNGGVKEGIKKVSTNGVVTSVGTVRYNMPRSANSTRMRIYCRMVYLCSKKPMGQNFTPYSLSNLCQSLYKVIPYIQCLCPVGHLVYIKI